MNRTTRWLSLLVTIIALGGAQAGFAIEADSQPDGSSEADTSYLSVDLISWDGHVLRTAGGDFVIDGSVEVVDERLPDQNGNMPETAHVELTFKDGALRQVIIY